MKHFTEPDNPLDSNDPSQWATLLEEVGPAAMLVYIERNLGPRLKALIEPEDIYQEACLHAWNRRGQFEWRGLANFRHWFRKIAKNRINDAADRFGARKRGHDRTTAISTLQTNDPTFELFRTTTAGALASHRESARRMNDALQALPEDLRSVLYKRLFEGKTMPEIASELDIGLSAAKHRQRRASELYEQEVIRRMQEASRAR